MAATLSIKTDVLLRIGDDQDPIEIGTGDLEVQLRVDDLGVYVESVDYESFFHAVADSFPELS